MSWGLGEHVDIHGKSNCRNFSKQFELYIASIGMEPKVTVCEIALLLTTAGPQPTEV